jgi:hyperosmotically inducible protein
MQNIKHLIVIGRITAVIAVASLVGCKQFTSSKDEERSEGRVADDKTITKTVESKLKAEPVYKFNDVDVKTYNGIVQLSGFVNTQEQSQRAEELSRQVGGVSQLINALVVKPEPMPSPTGRPSGQQAPPAGSSSTNINTNPSTP